MFVPTYSRMPKGPYIFSGSLAFTKALGRIGGMGDSVTDVLDLKFVVDLCQLLFVCIETLTNIFIKMTSLLPEGPFGVTCSVGGDIRGVRSVISFSTTNHHPNFNWYYSMNPRISTIASGKLAKRFRQLVWTPSTTHSEKWVVLTSSLPRTSAALRLHVPCFLSLPAPQVNVGLILPCKAAAIITKLVSSRDCVLT